MELNDQRCYRALTTRDARFDGLFFVGVTSTGIYCRPVCSARTPKPDRCRFFARAAEAEREGFRPCLKCRPELAPGNSPLESVGRIARAAASRIESGALDGGISLDALANELGVGPRQLRRAMRRELGVSPLQFAQTRRLLLAKQLLTETRIPISHVASASGFDSLRRFNASFRARYRLAPRQLRKAAGTAEAGEPLRLQLGYRPPLAWQELLRFLEGRAIAGVEHVAGNVYARTVELRGCAGWLQVMPAARAGLLSVEFSDSLTPVVGSLLARLRRLFDLAARPELIAAQLASDPMLRRSLRANPGLRVPGAFDGFELAWRAVLGQQVSVRGATTCSGRLCTAFGRAILSPCVALSRLTPEPERLAEATLPRLQSVGITRKRAEAIRALARAVAEGELCLEPGVDATETLERLVDLPGIGPWTAQYIAMRALSWPDAFPAGDLALKQGLGEPSEARLLARAEAWRPWRAYGAMHLWNQRSLENRS